MTVFDSTVAVQTPKKVKKIEVEIETKISISKIIDDAIKKREDQFNVKKTLSTFSPSTPCQHITGAKL